MILSCKGAALILRHLDACARQASAAVCIPIRSFQSILRPITWPEAAKASSHGV